MPYSGPASFFSCSFSISASLEEKKGKRKKGGKGKKKGTQKRRIGFCCDWKPLLFFLLVFFGVEKREFITFEEMRLFPVKKNLLSLSKMGMARFHFIFSPSIEFLFLSFIVSSTYSHFFDKVLGLRQDSHFQS